MKRVFGLPPNGSIGEAHISEVKVSSFEALRTRIDTARTGFPFLVEPGTYKRLHINHVLQMSNTQMEQVTNSLFIREARGKVLVAGLGIGFVLTKIIPKPEVLHVTVVEKSTDLIKLVGSHFACSKLTILHGDIYNWRPSEKYNVIYFDIWSTVTTENLLQMTKLHRAFKKYLLPGGYMNSWSYEGLQRMKRRGY